MIFRSTRNSGNQTGSPTSTPLQTVWILSVLVFLIDYTFEVLAFNRLYESQHFLLTLLQLTLSLWAIIELLIINQKQTPIPLGNLKIALFMQLMIGAIRFPIGTFFDSHTVFGESFIINLDFGLATIFVPIYLFLFLVISKLVINAFSYMERQRTELLQTEIGIRMQAEESLRKSEERYRLITDRATDVIWTIDTSGRFTYISPSVAKLRGYTPAEVMRQTMADALTPASLAVVQEAFQHSLANAAAGLAVEPFRGELEQPCKDGSTVWTEVTTNGLYSDDGQLTGFVGITRDITERRRFEAELRQARDAAETANLALQATNAELNQLATTDALTGAWNRRHFEQAAATEITSTQRYGEPLSLVLFDIDHFKSINDRYGHQTGDQVLVELTQLVRSKLRAADLLARWGGEEFVVMLPHCRVKDALRLAEKLRALVAERPFPDVGTVTASFGVVELLPNEGFDAWLKRVDNALYVAKSAGRNQVSVGNGEGNLPKPTAAALHLIWRSSYACGEPIIDEEHRELFRLANELLDLAIAEPPPDALLAPLDALLGHVTDHFAHEEDILHRRGYADLARHAGLHQRLVESALDLRGQVEVGDVEFGKLVEFLSRDVVARHMLQEDRAFFPLFAPSDADEPFSKTHSKVANPNASFACSRTTTPAGATRRPVVLP